MFHSMGAPYAEPDLSAYGEDALRALICQARQELLKRRNASARNDILYEDEYVRISFIRISLSDSGRLYIRCLCENQCGQEIDV